MWVWLVVALLAAVGETLTFDLFLASVSIAAIVVAVLSLVLGIAKFGIAAEILVFAGLSLSGIFYFRPLVKRALGIESGNHAVATVIQPLFTGKRGVVTQPVSADGGQIRLGGGEFWSARLEHGQDVLEGGTAVEIVMVEGITAFVEPVREELPQLTGNSLNSTTREGSM